MEKNFVNFSLFYYRTLQAHLNQIKSSCTKIGSEINSLRCAVNDKMIKKFGMKIDFDEMEETVLSRLLTNQIKSSNDINDKDIQVRKLKVYHQLELLCNIHLVG